MKSSKHVFQNGRHDGRPFGVPNDELANPALRVKEIEKLFCKKVDNCYSNCFKVFSSDVVRNLSTGGIDK